MRGSQKLYNLEVLFYEIGKIVNPNIAISPQCYLRKGFDEIGCYGCDCDDSCCKYGVDFNKESYDLVIANLNLIEPLIQRNIAACFESEWSNDTEFLGKNFIRSLPAENAYCVFHKSKGKGCVLYDLVITGNISRRVIPSICGLFPLTWNNGELMVYDQQQDAVIPDDCNCISMQNKTSKSILHTQRAEIKDIFGFSV